MKLLSYLMAEITSRQGCASLGKVHSSVREWLEDLVVKGIL